MTAPLVFLDTETTGLSLDDDIWEFAGIRRDPDGTETELHLFIDHDWKKCRELPESFREDHLARFPGHDQSESRNKAAHRIYAFLNGAPPFPRPHVVGAVPNFDTERLSRLIRAEIGAHTRDPWHHHLIDIENLAVGYLRGRVEVAPLQFGEFDPAPPWDSDDLSRAAGVEPPTDERHTAMGDARWAMAVYDRVMGVRP